MSRRSALVMVAGLTLGALGACGDGSSSSDSDSTGSSDPTVTAGDLERLPAFDTLDDIVGALDEADITCELEYEGLEDDDKVVSLCTISPDGGQANQATLTIWKDPALVAELVESGAATELTVYGQNWTIDLRDPAVASSVADALGGETG